MSNLKKQLKNLGEAVKLDKNASEEMRAILMSRVESDIAVQGRVKGNPMSLISVFTPSVRAILVSLIVVLIPGGGFTTVKAALGSLPGDLLYPVKITTEKIQVALVSDGDAKTELRVEFAERRLQEAEDIINNEENGEKEEKVAIAVEKFKEEIENITEDLEGLEDESQQVLEEKIALLNIEAEKIAQVVGAEELKEVIENPNTTEVVVVEEAENSEVITIINSQPIEPVEIEDSSESFKIQLQIIND